MRKTTFLKTLFFVGSLCVLLMSERIEAQIVIGTPNLGFSQACASASFNTYNVSFVFSPASGIAPSNQFRIELSDATGSFSNATTVYTSAAGAIMSSPATLTFELPSNTSGEAYKIRIKSSAPVATSSGSAAFAAYYKVQDSPFTINNLVATGAYCAGGSYLLTIDNPGTGDNDSPLQYDTLTFNWFKETGPTTSVFVASGSTLSVNQEGTYFVKTNYGTCTSSSFSNRVTINEVTSGEATASISSSLGSPYCPSEGLTTLSTISGLSYQWYKDGNLIPNATNQMYDTDEHGTYSVQVDLGNCQASGSFDLETDDFTSEINVEATTEMEEGDTLNIIVTTTAINPTFEWFLNDTIIVGAESETYNANESGDYRVIISQTLGCLVSEEFLFSIVQPFEQFPDVANIPNLISPNGDGVNDTWVIPTQYVSGTNTEIMILTNQGKIVLQTTDYQNNWPENALDFKSINPVYYYIIKSPNQKPKKGSITIVK